jgi:hypothetical protein
MRIAHGDDERERPTVRAPVPQAGDAAAVELAGVTKSYGRGSRAVLALDGVSAVRARFVHRCDGAVRLGKVDPSLTAAELTVILRRLGEQGAR